MLRSVPLGQFYDPEIISVMKAALDKACQAVTKQMTCQAVTKQMNGNDEIKKTLALIILRHVDRGECDPERLAETAFRELTGTDRSAIDDRWAATG